MDNSNNEVNGRAADSAAPWTTPRVVVLGAICLCLGLPIGYLARGSAAAPAEAPVVMAHSSGQQATAPAAPATTPAPPTPERMKHMADKSSAPLLAKLEKEPNNAVLLAQIARNYSAAEQLPEAISYYRRAVQADPKHVGNRADLASQLFYAGKVDEAIAALEEAGRYEPNNPQVLFNLGMMRWKGKGDAESAVAVWTKLLKSNPDLPADRKKQVEMAIAKLRGSAK